VHSNTRRDPILYALGADPMSRQQLRDVYEPDLVALPTIAVAYPGFWYRHA